MKQLAIITPSWWQKFQLYRHENHNVKTYVRKHQENSNLKPLIRFYFKDNHACFICLTESRFLEERKVLFSLVNGNFVVTMSAEKRNLNNLNWDWVSKQYLNDDDWWTSDFSEKSQNCNTVDMSFYKSSIWRVK